MNNTKIKYTVVNGKVYGIHNISFLYMKMELIPCDCSIEQIPSDELFLLDELKSDFKITIEK